MATQRFYTGNAKQTTLQVAMSPFITTVVLNSVTGLPTSFPFVLKLDAGTAVEEKVLATASAGGTSYTVQRGFDGTFAGSHAIGATATHVWSALDASDLSGHIFSHTEDDHTQYLRTTAPRNVTGFSALNAVTFKPLNSNATPLQTVVLPPNALALNSLIRLSTILTPGSATATRIGIKIGSTSIFPSQSLGFTHLFGFEFQIITTAAGASGALQVDGFLYGQGPRAEIGQSFPNVDTTSSITIQTTVQENTPSGQFTTQFWTIATVTGV